MGPSGAVAWRECRALPGGVDNAKHVAIVNKLLVRESTLRGFPWQVLRSVPHAARERQSRMIPNRRVGSLAGGPLVF